MLLTTSGGLFSESFALDTEEALRLKAWQSEAKEGAEPAEAAEDSDDVLELPALSQQHQRGIAVPDWLVSAGLWLRLRR